MSSSIRPNPFDFDIIIRNGIVVTASEEHRYEIGIKDGVITALAEYLPEPAGGCQIIDAEGGYITPGGVDSHVHIGQSASGARSADNWTTGTRSAIAGGTTTVIAFAVQARGTSIGKVIEDYHGLATGHAMCDYSFHTIVTDPTPEQMEVELPKMVAGGVTSIKIYMTYAAMKLNDSQILDVLLASRKLGVVTLIHCESHDLVEWISEKLSAAGLTEPWHHGTSRPPIVEAEATNRAIAMAELLDTPMLIVHVSAPEATNHIRNAQTRLLPLYGETCPHYALLTADKMHAPGFEGAKCVCAPPLRSDPSDRERIWEGLANGTFTVWSSDHAPTNYDDPMGKQLGMTRNPKNNPRGNFRTIPNGMPGVETRSPLLWSEGVLKGRLTRQKYVELNSTNAAKLYGLYPKKGTIQPGSDADLVIYRSAEARKPYVIKSENMHTAADYTPYEGLEIEDWPRLVLLRGKVAYDGASNEVRLKEGDGLFQRRGLSTLPGPRGISPFSAEVVEKLGLF